MSATQDRLHVLANRRLSVAEWHAYVDAPLLEREREEIASLIAWFQRRYPTPAARFLSARRALRKAAPRLGSSQR